MGTTYGDLFAANMRAARARANLDQQLVCDRMRALGFGTWNRTKVSEAERGIRPVVMAELLALAVSLECTITELVGAGLSDPDIEFPTGDAVGAVSVRNSALGMNDHAVRWDADTPTITRPANAYSARAWDKTLRSA